MTNRGCVGVVEKPRRVSWGILFCFGRFGVWGKQSEGKYAIVPKWLMPFVLMFSSCVCVCFVASSMCTC